MGPRDKNLQNMWLIQEERALKPKFEEGTSTFIVENGWNER